MTQDKLPDPWATRLHIPMNFIPRYRHAWAKQCGNEKKVLLKTWGGLGDQACTEPTLRYIVETFKDCELYLASEVPELFAHLPFKEVFDLRKVIPVEKNYLTLQTIVPQDDQSNLETQFYRHLTTHCVDYSSICALGAQLPVAYRHLKLSHKRPELVIPARSVMIHAGRHWASKTFPKDWWDAVISRILESNCVPVLIGADTDDNRGTVDVDASACLDLRNKLSILECSWVLQNAKVLLTNDSSPLHIAASGLAWIGFVATCKHPDFITHWRHGEWGLRMKNFGRGGVWDHYDLCPNKEEGISAMDVEESLLRSWLPQPNEMADWAVSKL